jgi:hypothetical protein
MKMTRQQYLFDAILDSRMLIARYFKGFDDTNHTRAAEHLPNHFAWTLGHLALTLHRAAEKLDRADLPASDFLSGDGRSGTRDRFDTENVCFGSKPEPNPAIYPTRARCEEIFNAAVQRFAATVRNATEQQLDAQIPWGNGTTSMSNLAVRMVFHTGTHAGQLADLRRALGLGSIFG